MLTLFPEMALLVRPRNAQVCVHSEGPASCVLFRATVAEEVEEPEECLFCNWALLYLACEPCLGRRRRLILLGKVRGSVTVFRSRVSGQRANESMGGMRRDSSETRQAETAGEHRPRNHGGGARGRAFGCRRCRTRRTRTRTRLGSGPAASLRRLQQAYSAKRGPTGIRTRDPLQSRRSTQSKYLTSRPLGR